jgi:DNA-binding HxlR family transcriptional regulator
MNKDTNMTYEEYKQKVKQGIITRHGNCPVTPLLLMLQGKWKNQIIYELCIKDPIRFSELKKNLSGITNTMLTTSLRELESDGLISRRQYNEIPPHVDYSFTQKGKDLLPIFYEMTKWGFKYIE